MKTVLIFGVFDRLHPGHIAFLKAAKKEADRLVVILARDEMVEKLKGKEVALTFDQRKQELEARKEVAQVLKGDENIGEYKVIERARPQVVAFGYDQTELQKDFESFIKKNDLEIEIQTLESYKPERYKSSILNGEI